MNINYIIKVILNSSLAVQIQPPLGREDGHSDGRQHGHGVRDDQGSGREGRQGRDALPAQGRGGRGHEEDQCGIKVTYHKLANELLLGDPSAQLKHPVDLE